MVGGAIALRLCGQNRLELPAVENLASLQQRCHVDFTAIPHPVGAKNRGDEYVDVAASDNQSFDFVFDDRDVDAAAVDVCRVGNHPAVAARAGENFGSAPRGKVGCVGDGMADGWVFDARGSELGCCGVVVWEFGCGDVGVGEFGGLQRGG